MPRFSDLLGGAPEGDEPGDEHEERSRPAPEPPSVRETPEDILERLTSYASAAGAREQPDEPESAQQPQRSLSLEELPPVDDDLLPAKRKKR